MSLDSEKVCPVCGEELVMVRQMFLRSVYRRYECPDSDHFRFPNSRSGCNTDEELEEAWKARCVKTKPDAAKLSDGDLRVKVATLRGWQEASYTLGGYCGYPPGTPTRGLDSVKRPLPDYPRNLNATHEVEEACINTAELQSKYARVLEKIAWDADGNVCWHATARQRAEALLVVLG